MNKTSPPSTLMAHCFHRALRNEELLNVIGLISDMSNEAVRNDTAEDG